MIPGAPPVKLLSVTDSRCTPFCQERDRAAHRGHLTGVPAASTPEPYTRRAGPRRLRSA